MVALYVGGKKDYEITESDLLWLGRAAQGEGGSAAAVIWSWLQRFALPSYRRSFPTLTLLVRAHSQAVNPRWMRGGDFCAADSRHAGTAPCAEALLDRRERNATRDPSAFSPEVKAAIAALRKGSLANPVPRAVDFASHELVESYIRNHPGSRAVSVDGNWHVIYAESARWPDGYVALGPGSSWPIVLGSFAAGLAIFGGAWWIWRRV